VRFDLVISGAAVMDPASGRDEVLNLGVKAGCIAALSREPLEAAEEIDGRGLVLSPGFIDIHTHEESGEGDSPEEFRIPRGVAACALATGNTTIVGGNCGESNYPVGEYLSRLEQAGLPINCVTLAGSTTLRRILGIGDYDAASPSQIVRMKSMALEAMDEGAQGVSFGLQYCPGTGFAEVLALCEAVRAKNKFFAVHMRYDTPNRAVEAVEEVIAAALITGAALQISHYAANVYGAAEGGGGNIEIASRLIEKSGADICADMYPYDTWAAYLKSAVFDHGFDDFNFDIEDLEILSGPLAGRYCTPELFGKLRRASVETTVACHNAIPVKDLETAYRLPFVCPASDALMSVGAGGVKKCHPRAAGSPARFLREFVREKKLMSLMEGIRKLTLFPANRLGLAKKGRIQEGCDADLCLFDPETITDKADFNIGTCAIPPGGVKAVISGGRVVYRGEA
jgi:N-acyl-D-amino-acid deacylase